MANWLTNLLGAKQEYRYGDLAYQHRTNLVLPPHPGKRFNESRFLILLKANLVLSAAEKVNVIRSLPSLSQDVIDGVMEVMADTHEQYRAMPSAYQAVLWGMEREALDGWRQVEACFSGTEVTVHERYERTIHVRRP